VSLGNYNGRNNISDYFGITQDPRTQDIMIVMPHYDCDLIHYITKDFYNACWWTKLRILRKIINGLVNLHSTDIFHRDLHSGNIFSDGKIGDLGISKSATDSTNDNNNENYGIIPYMAPEIFEGHKYTAASDIYSFGMIMWELMTGRRPFWDQNHDIYLIIEICDGLRPPIVTNAPEGYIELMKECWHSDPSKRPKANDISEKIDKMPPTKIIESPDIGPVTTNNPNAIYKSRPLSRLIQSAASLRSSRNQSINLEIGK
jgi:serine/threonine protein kinase